jgi:hypothetical protein
VLNIPVPAIGFNRANQFEAITGRTVLYLIRLRRPSTAGEAQALSRARE